VTDSPDPDDEDRLGWEAGYAANATLPVNASDGLNGSELEAVTARAMARVELIRGLEFEEPVPIEVISREAYRNASVGIGGRADDTLAEQTWEAPFLVGEDRNVSSVLAELSGSGVLGYYSSSEDRIVLVSDSPTPTVSRGTLAHELVHSLQDRRLTLRYPADTRDQRLASQGLTEGDAVLVASEYEVRCGAEWSCLDRPSGSPPPGGPIARNPGVYLTLTQPYVVGPAFVRDLRNRSAGWTAVNDAYEQFPESTEQTIHVERYLDEDPAPLTVEDRSTDAWKRVGNDTLGETSVHVMFWKQRFVPRDDDSIRTDYEDHLSEGWANDRLVAYRVADQGGVADGASGGAASREGYVWRLVWDSPADAREFRDAYTLLLRQRFDAEAVRGGRNASVQVYSVPDGPFADAFRVRLSGDTVTVVNAPSVDALAEVGGDREVAG
jgi:hypothetical protein